MILWFEWISDVQINCDMVKHELQVTTYELRVESLIARVKIQSTSSNPQVTSSNPWGTSSYLRVQESLNQGKLEQTAFKFILEIKK